MYIHPFLCGVIATILAEIALLVIAAVLSGPKNK